MAFEYDTRSLFCSSVCNSWSAGYLFRMEKDSDRIEDNRPLVLLCFLCVPVEKRFTLFMLRCTCT